MFFRRKRPKRAKPATPRARPIDAPGYRGPERRQQVRRDNAGERRAMVRWEPDKGERRRNHGRRATDSRWMHH